MRETNFNFQKREARLWKNALPLLVFLLLLGLNSLQAQDGQIDIRKYHGEEAARIIPMADYVMLKPFTSYPAFVKMNETSRVQVSEFFNWLHQSISQKGSVDFRLLKQEKDELGFEHHKYVQTYQGVPVDKSTYVIASKEGIVTSFNGFALNAPDKINATPALSESQALEKATEFVGATTYKWELDAWNKDLQKRTNDPNASYFPKGELVWHVDDDFRTFRLAYRFDINAADPDQFQRVYVDAVTGAILKKLPMESNCEPATNFTSVFNGTRTVRTDKFTANDFRLRDDCQAAEIWIRDWGGADLTNDMIEIQNTTNTWTTMNERFGATVLWLTNQAYAYWLNVHGRASYDNANGSLTGYINAQFNCSPPAGCITANNASMSFTGGNMKVGLSSAGTLANSYATVDIIGHEYAHAVTGTSAGLVYEKESGALNESFSDIFGESNENFTLGSNDWLMGDERTNGAIRDLSNPKNNNDPDTYLGTNWVSTTTPTDVGGDNWGVHTNSGVQNHWFYLLAVGGSGTNDNSDSYTVSGIGLAKARAIAYRNLVMKLGNNSTYADARDGAIQSAVELYGACSDEVKQTTNAWYAVGVGAEFFDATASVTSNYNGRDVSCRNECDGSATVNVVSSFAPTYSWSHGPSTASVSNLCPGNYSVTVTNLAGLGCSVVRNLTIDNTPLLTASPAVTSNYNGFGVSCYGENDGTGAANAAGGTPPYSYLWSNGQTTANATGLAAGPYSVTITDANGCTTNGNINVSEPPLLTTTASPTSNYNGYNISCNGGSDGSAEAFPSGGVPPYSYSWTSGATTKEANNLSATSYTVTVTDANGCTASAQTMLNEPPPLTIDAGANKTVYYGYPDSACAQLTATGIGGGVPPYTLSWSTGSSNASINVCPIVTTTYTVTVTDLNGCMMSDEVKVCVIDVRCGNKLDKVTICHNTGSDNNPSNTQCIALNAVANHLLSHGDQLAACGTVKACVSNKMVYSPNNGISEPSYLTAFPNPFADFATVRFMIAEGATVNVKVYDIAGREVSMLYNTQAEAGKVYNLKLDGTRYPSGVYFIILKTDTGEQMVNKVVMTK